MRLPAGSGAHALLSPFTVPATAASGAVKSALTTAKSPVAAPYVWPDAVTGAPTKCGTLLAPADSARGADPGDSTVNKPGPELPAATATTMLASSRLST